MPSSENQIVLERTFSVPRERVFAALTQADQIPQWMKSTDMKLATCEVDLRVATYQSLFDRLRALPDLGRDYLDYLGRRYFA